MKMEPQCSKRRCKHFQGFTPDEDEDKQRPVCKAFPKGIPDSIAYGNDKHLVPLKGQKGKTVFKKRKKNK